MFSWEVKMPSQQLDNMVRIGKLKAEPAPQLEIDGLMRSGAARVKDAENERPHVPRGRALPGLGPCSSLTIRM